MEPWHFYPLASRSGDQPSAWDALCAVCGTALLRRWYPHLVVPAAFADCPRCRVTWEAPCAT